MYILVTYKLVKIICKETNCFVIFNSMSQIFLALECLRLILVRITSDLRKYKSSAQSVVQQLVSTAMSAIYSQLSVKNKSSHIKSALKILCIMVKQGNWAAKEILTRLDLSDKNMILLLNRKDMKVQYI